MMVSLPLPPLMVSLPALPRITSAFWLPVRVSLPPPPSMLTMPVSVTAVKFSVSALLLPRTWSATEAVVRDELGGRDRGQADVGAGGHRHDRVIAGCAGHGIEAVAGAGELDGVVSVTAVDGVVASLTGDDVVPVRAVEGVVAATPEDVILAGSAGEGVRTCGADEQVTGDAGDRRRERLERAVEVGVAHDDPERAVDLRLGRSEVRRVRRAGDVGERATATVGALLPLEVERGRQTVRVGDRRGDRREDVALGRRQVRQGRRAHGHVVDVDAPVPSRPR